jgi:hypothetical protein
MIQVLVFAALPLLATPPSLLPAEVCEQCVVNVAADFNGDGLDDVLDRTSLRVNLDGRFGPAVSVSGIGGADALVNAGDYNGDGLADVIVRNVATPHHEGPDRLLLGNGSGSFATGAALPAQLGSVGHNERVDWNADGKLDLVLLRAGALAFLRGNGDGTFALDREIAWEYPAFPSMAFADFNRDGKRDAVLTPHGWPYLHFYISGASGTWVEDKRFIGADAKLAPAADLNGDGNADVTFFTSYQQKLALTTLFGDGTGHFLNTSSIAGGSFRNNAAGDFFEGGGDELAYVDEDNGIEVVSGTGNQLHVVSGTSSGFAGTELLSGRFHTGAGLDLLAIGQLGYARPALRVIVADGALPLPASTPSRRMRAVSRGSAAPALQAATYEGRALGMCPMSALDTWSFTREGIFVHFGPTSPIEAAMLDGKMIVRATVGERRLAGTLTVTNDTLSGDLFDMATNACGTPGKLSVYAKRVQ